MLFQRMEVLSQGGKGKNIIQVLFFHSTQTNSRGLQISGYQESGCERLFHPYLKVFLHSSGLDPDCNSFLCV